MSKVEPTAGTEEAKLERLDDEALARLVKERANQPTIRVSVEDQSGPDDAGEEEGLKAREMRGEYRVGSAPVGWVLPAGDKRPEAVTHHETVGYAALTHPTGWRRGTLGELLPIKYGKSLPEKLRDTTGSHPVFGSSGQVGAHSAHLTAGPTLIIGRKGNVGAIHYSSEPCWPIDTVYYVEPPEGQNLRYYKYLLESLNLVKLDKSTAVPGLSRDDYNAVEVVVAPPDQQDGIVAEIEKQFSRLDEAVANLKRYKAAVLNAAVEGRLVETEAELARREGRSYETGAQLLQRILETRRCRSGFSRDQRAIAPEGAPTTGKSSRKGKYKEPTAPDTTDLPELPEGWVWALLDQLSDVVRGGSPRPAGDPRYFGGPVPWITVGPLTADESDYLHRVPEGLTLEGKERSRYIEPNTLLLTNSGATLGVPKISLIGGCINDGVAALLDVDYPLKRYLVNFLRTRTMSMRSINQGAAQPNLNTSIIKAMIVPLPPEAEQHRIVAEVDRRLSLLRVTETQVDANLQRAERLRQSILTRAFAGYTP